MAQITKPFYVIYDSDNNIIDLGLKTSNIFTGQPYAEFSTLAELDTFITEQQLILPEEKEVI